MKISLSWLREYVEVPWSVENLAERLTLAGLEVEGIEDQSETFHGFVVGRVLTCEKHPKADRLSVCTVDVGEEALQIVCGAPNVAAGQKVIVGRIGATVPHNQHDPSGKPFVLGKVKLRGIESHGMICSEKELGRGEDADGIMLLGDDTPVGAAASEALGADDVVLDIAITPNRADCLSHVGIARDIAAMTGGTVKLPEVTVDETEGSTADLVSIEIQDPALCPRYSGRVISNVRSQPSPSWMQKRLLAVGMRPLNAIVDVTNYVMLELGQPLHAFDLEAIRGGKIVVRRAADDSTFTTLDGKERSLAPDTIMICDAERPVAVGGVMGGLNSEIGEATNRVLIESATFDPSSIRKTARSFGLSTEASYRFERGVDPAMTVRAADRAAALLHSITGAAIHAGILDSYPGEKKRQPIVFRISRTNEILGTRIGREDMREYLERLGCAVHNTGDNQFSVIPPTYRMDLVQEIDLVEEVARVHGYDNIETKTKAAIDFSSRAGGTVVADVIRSLLVGIGYNEIRTLSLQKEGKAALADSAPIHVLNPVSAEMQALRPSLIPEALEVAKLNLHRGRDTFRLFEVGSVFALKKGGSVSERDDFLEDERVMLLQTGLREPSSFDRASASVDLLDLKGDCESLLHRLHLDKYRFIPYDARKTLTDQTIAIEINGQTAGSLGRVRPDIAKLFDIDQPVFVCEVTVSMMGEGIRSVRQYRPLPRYPSVQRDLAFVVSGKVSHMSLEGTIREAAGPLLESVSLFDAYTGDQVKPGMKSLAYELVFRSADRTLTDSDVDAVVKKIIGRVGKEHGASLRS